LSWNREAILRIREFNHDIREGSLDRARAPEFTKQVGLDPERIAVAKKLMVENRARARISGRGYADPLRERRIGPPGQPARPAERLRGTRLPPGGHGKKRALSIEQRTSVGTRSGGRLRRQ
jgi:hypothetical protein